MRLQGLDLNLLVALEALLQEENVSAAAVRIHVAQSTLSGSLSRLRDYFGDDLLTPIGRRLVRTPRGDLLLGAVTAILAQVKTSIIATPSFEPASSTRTFSVVASDYAITVALAEGVVRIAREAPSVVIELSTVDGQAKERLERGDVDLLVTLDKYLSTEHPRALLFEDDYVVAAWAGSSKIGRTLDAAEYFALGHVVVRFDDRTPSFEEWSVRSDQRARRVEAVAPSFSLAPHLVVGTDRITTMHRKLAEIFAALMPLKLLPVPFEIPPIRQMVQWRSSAEGDAALAWVRRRLIDGRRVETARPTIGTADGCAPNKPFPQPSLTA